MATHRFVRARARRVDCGSRSRRTACNRAQGYWRGSTCAQWSGMRCGTLYCIAPHEYWGIPQETTVLTGYRGRRLLAGNGWYRVHYDFTSGSLVWQRPPRWERNRRVFYSSRQGLIRLPPQKVRRPAGEGHRQLAARLAARGGKRSRWTGLTALVGFPVWRRLAVKWMCLASKRAEREVLQGLSGIVDKPTGARLTCEYAEALLGKHSRMDWVV